MDVIPNKQLDERTARLKRLNVQRVQRCRARKQDGALCAHRGHRLGRDARRVRKDWRAQG